MVNGECKGIWSVDDFTACARHHYLEVIVPSFLLGLSITFILYHFFDRWWYKPQRIKLNLAEDEAPLLATNGINKYNSLDDSEDSQNAETDFSSDITDRHFNIKYIKPEHEDGTPIGVVKTVFRGHRERLLLALLFVVLLAQVSYSALPFFISDFHEEWKYSAAPLTHFIFWTYQLVLTSVRLAHSSTGLTEAFPNLWYHTFDLNLAYWWVTFFLARSGLLNNTKNGFSKTYYLLEFLTCSLMVLIQGFDNFSDRTVSLYIEDELTPTPEPMSCFFNIASFYWVTDMINKAQTVSTTMNDILCLKLEDSSYPSLLKFHQSRRFNNFSVDIFWQFRKLFFYQSLITSIEAVLMFFPSMLLKTILEYVASPETESASLAWLFVILMLFAAPITSALSGRGLFLGRRICTRMRAILIGEIYAKALRKKLSDCDSDIKDETTTNNGANPELPSDADNTQPEVARDIGAVINLIAVDSFKVSEICGYLHYFVNSFVMTVIAISILYTLLGTAALVGVLTIVLLLPINYRLSMLIGKYQKQMLKVTDKRISKLNETFQNIRIIKYFAWENKFAEEILKVRNEELHILAKRCSIWAVAAFIWLITPTLVCLVSFYWYSIVEGNTLTTAIAFTALSLFNLLRTPLDQFADMLSFVIQSKVSLDRISDYLDEPESTKYKQLSSPRDKDSPELGFQKANFSWSNSKKGDFKLRDIDIAFKKNKLNVIIGATGAGKSSLLLALLGEMNLQSGKVFLPGATPRDELVVDRLTGLTESVAYCSQSAWLLNGTIRENILFASPYDESRYKAVVEACGLKRDFEILAAGDKTEVGEKGITLSGGQKQRVSLARALYSNAAYVLLDDCLSAVDSHTSVHIYEQCITGALMRNRTCILVSHNISLTIKDADYVVIMDNGRVRIQGDVDYLFSQKAFDEETITSILQSRSASTANLDELAAVEKTVSNTVADHPHLLQSTLAALSSDVNADMIDPDPTNTEEIKIDKTGKLVEEETKSEGSVSWSVYSLYITLFGDKWVWTLLFTVFIFAQGINIGQSYWLRVWGRAEDSKVGIESLTTQTDFSSLRGSIYLIFYQASNFLRNIQWNEPILANKMLNVELSEMSEFHSTLYYLVIYSLIGFLYAVTGLMRVLLSYFGGLRVSRKIFKILLFKVLRGEVRFFDSTPIGRIMNRFSKDIEGIDQELAPCAEMAIICALACITTVLLITFITPAFLIFGVVMSYAMINVGKYYLTISRELKRFEAITRSPINQHFTETLVGVTTLRAYGDERRFMVQNMTKIDANNRPFFYVWVNNRWMSFRAQLAGALLIVFAAGLAVSYAKKIDAGLAGISLSIASSFSVYALWLLRCYADVEINLNAVERVQEYIDNVKQEPPSQIPENDPPSSWPENGEIEVKNLSLRYAPRLPQVIKDISFHVKAGEKVGVVGRTGAGKSTIITSFFRFIEPDSGTIYIDGVDIGRIGLDKLRRGLTIIPQEPTLFSGTLRSNLDMFGEYNDVDMYESLRRVGLLSVEEFKVLKLKIEAGQSLVIENSNDDENVNKFIDLDSEVIENGGNLSQGERQLVCLARSLLKSPKILMLDEATASIDYDTDAKIQTTIREEFSQSTILTIAHRLKTIIDYDKILVLDHGSVKEYDHPYKLITNKSTEFHSMCMDTGEFTELVKLAMDAYQKNNQSNTTVSVPEDIGKSESSIDEIGKYAEPLEEGNCDATEVIDTEVIDATSVPDIRPALVNASSIEVTETINENETTEAKGTSEAEGVSLSASPERPSNSGTATSQNSRSSSNRKNKSKKKKKGKKRH